MKIGIDARPLRHPYTGIGKYLEQILRVLAIYDKENEYFLYSHQDFELSFPITERWHIRIGWGGVGTIWLHTQLPFMIARDKLDVFWGPQYAIPFWPRRLPRVITVHDLVFHHYPETLPTLIWLHNKYVLHRYLAAVDKVIADSHSTKNDLLKVYKTNEEKLQVIHLAAECAESTDTTPSAGEELLKKLQITSGYILCVGTVEPRKNLMRLLEAYANVKKGQGVNAPFVIAGSYGWKYQGILQRVDELGLSEQVIFTGRLTETELDVLYRNALIFVYPSLYEGFGLPPLEAMLRGIPVITSNTSSLPEVVGDAGIIVDPYNVQEIASAILNLYTNEDLRKDYSLKGTARAREFSWEKTAQATLDVLKDAFESKKATL
ncbi:MAG: glycosyltransferase family 1 protein [Carboxydocellales bacterium]